MAMSKEDAPTSTENREATGRTRTETIIWGFHLIYQFRDTFKAAGLLTAGVEHDLIQLQDQLVWLLVDTNNPLGER